MPSLRFGGRLERLLRELSCPDMLGDGENVGVSDEGDGEDAGLWL